MVPVIAVNKVVDPKRRIGKMKGQGGGEAQGVADPKRKKRPHLVVSCHICGGGEAARWRQKIREKIDSDTT
jgi:hypothetical protein